MTVTNSSNETSSGHIERDVSPDYVSTGALTLVVVVGVFGNLLVIYSILKRKVLLKKNYYYLVSHLAVCDLMLLLCYVPLHYSSFVPVSSIIFSYLWCKVFSVIATLFLMGGSNFMVLIAIFRYRAVLHPLKPAVGRCKVRIFAGLVYIFSFICVIPYIIVLKFSRLDGCYEEWPHLTPSIIYTIFLTAIQYLIPAMTLSFLYYKIFRKLIKQNEMISSMNSTSAVVAAVNVGTQTHIQRVEHHRNIRAFRNCVPVVIFFVVSAFPTQCFAILYHATDVIPRYPATLYSWIEVVNLLGTCAINPVIYGILDKRLKSAFKRCLTKIKNVFASCKNWKQHTSRENFLMEEINVLRQSPTNNY